MLSCPQVLIGYFVLPNAVDQQLECVINPMGNALRSRQHVWNTGDFRIKFAVLAPNGKDSTVVAPGGSLGVRCCV